MGVREKRDDGDIVAGGGRPQGVERRFIVDTVNSGLC
jgi:hypothetical protein